MINEKSVSNRVCTHNIFYYEGDILKTSIVTENEAKRASQQWQAWRPVPIPILDKNSVYEKLINPTRISEINKMPPRVTYKPIIEEQQNTVDFLKNIK